MTMKANNIARKLEVEEDTTTADLVLVVGGADDADADAAAEILATFEEEGMVVDEPSVDDSSVFEFVYEEVKESENSDGGTIKMVENVDESPTASGEISDPVDADELTVMAVDSNSTSTQQKQDLFQVDHQQDAVSTEEEDPVGTPDTKSEVEAYLVLLLDFELTLLFAEPERRRYLRSSSSVRHRKASQSDLRSIMVKETLTDYLDNFYEMELSKRREAGVDYSPLDEIYLSPDESQERVVAAKSTATGELYDEMYSTAYTGVAIFHQEDEGQRVLKEFSVQSMQLQALNEALNDDSELLLALQDVDVGGSTGLDRVQSISARILTSKDEEGSSTRTAGTTQPGTTVNTQPQPSSGTGSLADTVVIAAVAVAAVSLVLLGLSVFVSYLRQKNKSHKTTTASRKGKFPQARSSRGGHNSHWNAHTSPDEIPYAISGTLASSSSPTEPGQNGTQGFSSEKPINVPSEVIPATLEPYPDGVSVSAVSEVSSLGQVIMEAIKAYSSEAPKASNEAKSPDSQDIFIGEVSQHMVDGDESVGVMSLDDSSTLGYSLAGYTIGDGTKCGY